jgi:hypothetical protein
MEEMPEYAKYTLEELYDVYEYIEEDQILL